MKTQVSKGYYGWTAENTENFNGYNWKITTMKRHHGKITCTAQAGTASPEKNGFSSFSFMAFSDPSVKLCETTGKATEKTIRETHIKGLLKFDEMKEAGTLPSNGEIQKDGQPYEIPIGQIFESYFPQGDGDDGNEYICYEIAKDYGTYYRCVNPKTLQLRNIDHPRPWSKKFGIGTYYTEGNIFSDQDALNNMVIEAQAKARKEQQRSEAAEILSAQIEAGKIEEGKKLITVPSWAKAVIVASNYQNDSDSMTDYFSTSVSNRMILAYSKTTRNNMGELRKAALNFPETADFPERADKNSENKYDEVKEINNGNSGTYIPSYCLGTSQWYGWKVEKLSTYYIDPTTPKGRDKIYKAAAEGRYFVPEPETPKKQERPGNSPAIAAGLEIVDYSQKAIAVIGDTKPVKDNLKALGGKFNPRLSCGPGWIFSKTKEAAVRNFISGNAA